MKILRRASLLVTSMVLALTAAGVAAQGDVNLDGEDERIAYAIGSNIGQNLQAQGLLQGLDVNVFVAGMLDANLQGCINLAMQQQGIANAGDLSVLSCANSEIRELENIAQLANLRFLDLGDNNIRNVTPLEDLRQLSGLNLNNNVIDDVTPLLNIASLASVSLLGNGDVPCNQLNLLRDRLGENLIAPQSCRN